MAQTKDQAEVANPAANGVQPVDWNQVEWETHSAESGTQIVFDTIGDQFVGLFLGTRTAYQTAGEPDTEFTILTFKGTNGEVYQHNAGWKLEEAFSDIEPQTIVRISYVKDVDTGRPSPMKDFRVDVARMPH